jgi:ABC-2 type transport system permease protein
MLKYISCVIYTFAFIFFIGVTALIAGVLYRGMGGLFVFAQFERLFALYETGPGLARYFCALPLLALSLTTVTSLGFMFSCFNMKPATATVITLAIIFLDFIFRNNPVFESLQPYFMTTHIHAWLQAFVTPVHVWSLVEDYTYLLAVDATCLVIAFAAFQRRDFKA